MVPGMILNKLNENEFTVYSSNAAFSIPEASLMGNKTVHITNKGRVFVHDTGGIFGDEKIWQSNDVISVTLYNHNVIMTNSNPNSFSFRVTLTISEFISSYKKILPQKLKIEQSSSENICYISYNFSNGSSISYDEISIKNDHISLSIHPVLKKIPFYRIHNIKSNNDILTISGVFNGGERNISKIEIFLPYKDLQSKITNELSKQSNIFNSVGKTNNIFPIKIKKANEADSLKQSLTIAFNSENIFLLKEGTAVKVNLQKGDYQFFYHGKNKQLLIIPHIKSKASYVIESQHLDFANFVRNNLVNKTNLYFPDFGKLYGEINNEFYKNDRVSIAINRGHIYLLTDKAINEIDYNSHNIKFLFDDCRIFILSTNEICLITSNDIVKFKKEIPSQFMALESDTLQKVGFTAEDEPFFIEQTQEHIVIEYNKKNCVRYNNDDITDVSISKHAVNDSLFSEVTIMFNDNHNVRINILSTYTKDLIYNTYYFTKSQKLPAVASEQLFVSYSRQVNDYVLYHYFGQLMALYEGLKEISSRNESKDIKNRAIINYLYHTIQSQKKHFDTVSIYLPSMLEQTDSKVLNGVNQASVFEPYKKLQRGLMGITSQISRSLNEIESSISAVSFALIPQQEYSALIDKRRNRGYATAGVMGVAALAFPPLLIGASLMGLNSYFASKDAKEQEEIRKQNENNRLDFYVAKIMDSFNHFIETLLPFYVTEVNQSVFQTFTQLHLQYQPVLHLDEIKESLFYRITQLHTFKQLPIDETVTLKKNHLINATNDTIELANSHLNLFLQEVEEIVPKSIEAPRLG